MYKALVCCRAGMGSSMLLKIKADQVISENGYPIQTEHGNLDSLNGFSGDLVITMDDLADELKDKGSLCTGDSQYHGQGGNEIQNGRVSCHKIGMNKGMYKK